MWERKFDYDGDEFYDEVFAMAMNGATDMEIAIGLKDRFGVGLSPEAFCKMKAKKYNRWTEEENEKYGGRLVQVLTRARAKTNFIVRSRYLKAALGGIKTKNVTTERRKLKINGTITEDEEIRVSETEFESSPNIQALATWLYHHDTEWRKIQQDAKEEDLPQANKGVEIDKWIAAENDKDT